MRIISDTTDFCVPGDRRLSVAIGKFDGVHLGHLRLLKEIISSRQDGMVPAVFTFDPDPMSLFTGRVIPQLTTRAEKRRILEGMGIEILVEFPMTRETAAIQPEQFITEYLSLKLNAGLVAAGTDLSFGYKGRGDCLLLKAMGSRYGFETRIIDKVMNRHREISSTFIREELERGNIALANKLMGRDYCVSGEIKRVEDSGNGGVSVIFGVEKEKLLPGRGEYPAVSFFGGSKRAYESVCSVGVMPEREILLRIPGKRDDISAFSGDMRGMTAEVLLKGT